MDDKEMKMLFQTMEGALPPDGLKESILEEILKDAGAIGDEFSFLQRLFFFKPLRPALVLAVSLSALLWVIFRDAYINLLFGFIG